MEEKIKIDYKMAISDGLLIVAPFVLPLGLLDALGYLIITLLVFVTLVILFTTEAKALIISRTARYTNSFKIYDFTTDVLFIVVWAYFDYLYVVLLYLLSKLIKSAIAINHKLKEKQ